MLENKVTQPQKGFYKRTDVFVNEKLPLTGKKALRAQTLHTATITYEDKVYNADEDSIRRMGYYLTNASAQYAKARSSGSSGPTAYTACYTNVTITWKFADNSTGEISIATLAEVYKLAVEQLNNNWN